MKKKIAIISGMIVFLLILFFPIKAQLDDGGTVIYMSIAKIYEIRKIKTYDNVGMTLTMKEGLSIKLFGREVYHRIDKEYLAEQKDWGDANGTCYFDAKIVEMTAEEILEKAQENICVVSEDLNVISGDEYWEKFLEKVEEEKNAQIRLVKYYTLGEEEKYATGFYESIKDEYPKVYFYSLVYVAGEGFWLGIRSNAKEEPEQIRHYNYMKHFGGDTVSSDSVDSHYDRYVLVDDDSVTWKAIMEQMIRSVRTEDDIVWQEVYCNYIE